MIDGVTSRPPADVEVPSGEPSETDLVLAAQQGDREAFAALVRRHQGAVCAMAYAMTGRLTLSQDVGQETFLVAWRRLGEIKQPERFRGWLLGVARKKSLRALREQRASLRQTSLPSVAQDVPSPEPSPLDRAIDHEEEQFVWRALKKIPETYRLPLVLFYREQRSLEAVASMLDLSYETVQMRLVRGRRLLQQHVTDVLESVLTRSKPGKAFVASTMAALMLAGAGPASAGARGLQAGKAATAKWLLAGVLAAGTIAGAVAVLEGPVGVLSPLGSRAHSSPLVPVPPPAFAPSKDQKSVREAARPDPGEATRLTAKEEDAATVLQFDFEDGVQPTELTLGHVAVGPERPGNRYAAMGSVLLWEEGWSIGVQLNPKDLHHREGLALAFDYWVGDLHQISVEILDADRKAKYSRVLTPNAGPGWKGVSIPEDLFEKVPSKRWKHVFLPLALLVAAEGAPAMEAGDLLTRISVFAGRVGGSPLFIDNVRIVDCRPGGGE